MEECLDPIETHHQDQLLLPVINKYQYISYGLPFLFVIPCRLLFSCPSTKNLLLLRLFAVSLWRIPLQTSELVRLQDACTFSLPYSLHQFPAPKAASPPSPAIHGVKTALGCRLSREFFCWPTKRAARFLFWMTNPRRAEWIKAKRSWGLNGGNE